MLARGAEDLADLRDQRLDVVADAALAELAEAGEVAADLGRVDVGVLGEFLRGDRLAAHLARLGQHLQVAREARRDAEREPLAVDDQPSAASSSSMPLDHRPHSIEPGPNGGFVEDQLGDDGAVDLDHRDLLQQAAQQQLVALDVDLVQLEAVALARAGRRSPRSPPRRDGSRAASRRRRRSRRHAGGARRWRRRRSRGSRGRRCAARSGRRSRSSPRCRCRARSGPASGARRAPRRARPPPRAAARWRRRRRRARPPPTRPSSAPARSFAISWPTTAAWKLAARSARRSGDPSGPRSRQR